MAEIDIRNLQNEVVGKLELSDDVFKAELNQPLIWEAVRHHADSRRNGGDQDARPGQRKR
jgi:ribosomal protein L4